MGLDKDLHNNHRGLDKDLQVSFNQDLQVGLDKDLQTKIRFRAGFMMILLVLINDMEDKNIQEVLLAAAAFFPYPHGGRRIFLPQRRGVILIGGEHC